MCWLGLTAQPAQREDPVSGGGKRHQANEPGVFFLPPVYVVAALHSLLSCPELFEHCSVIATALGDLGRKSPVAPGVLRTLGV